MRERRKTMIAGQAIKGVVMDYMQSATMTGPSSSFETSTTKRNDAVSFETLLSKRAVSYQTEPLKAAERASAEVKPTLEKTETNEVQKQSNTVETSNQAKCNVKDDTVAEVEKEPIVEKDGKLNEIAQVIEEVKEIILDNLEISEEELVSMMEVLGLTMVDLLNPEALKQLTLENAGIHDSMMLLTDEGLNQQLSNLLNQVQTKLTETGITQQEISELVTNESEFTKLMELVLTDVKETLPDDVTNNVTIRENSSENTNKETSKTTTESQIEFSVERVGTKESAMTQSNADSNQSEKQGFTQNELTDQFLNQMVNSTQTTQTEFTQQMEGVTELREIANQVIEQIKLIIKPDQTSMEFNLNPEHLGKVALNITSKEGIITATFTTQNQIAKEAIESQLQIFKENLSNQGIKVESIEVNVSNFSFEGSSQMDQSNSSQQETAKGKKSPFSIDMEDSAYLEEALSGLMNDDTADYGNNFDYTA
jgi:flagellar hook-length control protein FliK